MTPIVFAVFSLLAVSGVLSQTEPPVSRDPCPRVVCQNGGTCIAPFDLAICQCASGYGGNRCQNQVPVKIGTCPAVPNIGELNCTRGCDNDYNCTGTQKCCNTNCRPQCTSNIIRDPCSGFVCLNGGTCTAPADAPYCQCPPGFSGRKCEFSIRPGTCPVIKKGDVSVCGGVPCTSDKQCPYNQKCCTLVCGGTFCTTVDIIRDPCRGFVCLNGGTCTAPADAPYCQCPTGFSGPKCEFSNRLGTCPVIKKGDVSVCGGVPCTYDQQCPYNQKCCTLACGGTFCTNVEQPPTLTCANVLCNVGSVCRYVSTCSSCPVGPTCVPVGQVYYGIDNECRRQNYTQVVLVENTRLRSEYNQLTCTSRYQTCPSGSACAGGLCCQGKVTSPLTKPGICPNASVCNGTACTNDYECPGEQKCCPGCRKICRDPIFDSNYDQCGNTRCPPGLVCVLRTPYCPPGRFCILAFLPVCVRPQCVNCTANEDCVPSGYGYVCTKPNKCGNCPLGQVCRPTRRVCVTTPCPQYACVPIDRCGGCPGGQVCRLNSCITKTCASYQCYPDVAY